MKYYIFGAHSRGQTLGVYLRKLHSDWSNLGYLYDNDEENPGAVDGVPVIRIDEGWRPDADAKVYLATRGVSFDHEKELLTGHGVGASDIIPVDFRLDTELRNAFVKEYFAEKGRKFERLDEISAGGESDVNAVVYAVRSAYDAPLSDDVPLRGYEQFIQAGRALEKADLAGCSSFDNVGENISDRNRQMCELTALYWIWKNADQECVGVEHYRRRFILPDGWESSFAQGKVDAVLPVPLYVRPSLMGNYVARHECGPWEVMMRQLKSQHGQECYDAAADFFENSGCYSPCNMLIARREVFSRVCEFVFPIVFAVMEECGTIEDNYQNRYPGFLSERLISFFFYYYRDRFKVVYADKTFLM